MKRELSDAKKKDLFDMLEEERHARFALETEVQRLRTRVEKLEKRKENRDGTTGGDRLENYM